MSAPSTQPDRAAASQLVSEDHTLPGTTLNDLVQTTVPVVVSLSSNLNNPDQISVSTVNSEDTLINPTLDRPDTDSPPSAPTTYLPDVNPPPLPPGSLNMGNLSRAATFEAIVTTVVHTVLDPHDPAYLTVAEFCTTLKYRRRLRILPSSWQPAMWQEE